MVVTGAVGALWWVGRSRESEGGEESGFMKWSRLWLVA